MQTLITKSLLRFLLTLTFLFSAPVYAFELQPFDAEFKVSINKLPSLAKASLHLKQMDQPGFWKMEFFGKHIVGKAQEQSVFEWKDCDATPKEHSFTASSLKIKIERKSEFDWKAMSATVEQSDEETSTIPLSNNTYDELSLYMAARCQLAQGAKELSFTIARGKRLRQYHYKVVGEDVIRTAFGKIKTLRIERVRSSSRKTQLWVAPDLNYMLVRLKHTESFALQGQIDLKSYKVYSDGPDKAPSEPIPKKRKFFFRR